MILKNLNLKAVKYFTFKKLSLHLSFSFAMTAVGTNIGT